MHYDIMSKRQYHQDTISKQVLEIRYRGELRDCPDVLLPLMRHVRQGRVTLLSASRDLSASHLPILRDAILNRLEEEDAADRELASPLCYQRQLEEDDRL